MSETAKRFLVATIMLGIFCIAAVFHQVHHLTVLIALAMIVEYVICVSRVSRDVITSGWNLFYFSGFLVWLLIVLIAANVVGNRPLLILMIFLIIAAADSGAWFFGKNIGGDKMWERISANKTWSGQIFGIVCGALVAVLYSKIKVGTFMPQMVWIGIGVSLLSQYGDLTASYIKRKLGIKDFSNLLPGHGGLLDRFDGWIYVLPLVWLIMK